jgi:vitamin B12 transporter
VARRGVPQVVDLLREAPGVLVVGDGPRGQFSRLHVRGAASNQTLVIVDGIPQNDATTGGGFDFNDLLTGAVERVEVLRGSYGVLYGSEAVGGVVRVTTRRGGGPTRGFLSFEGGSFDTFRGAAGMSGGEDGVEFALTLGAFGTDGERDGEAFTTRDVTGRVGLELAPTLRGDVTLRHVDTTTESPFDFGVAGAPLPEDRNIERDRATTSLGLGLEWEAEPWLTVRAHGSLLAVVSDFDNGADGATTIDPDFTPGSGDEFDVVRDELHSESDETDVRARLDLTAVASDLLEWTDPSQGGLDVELTAGGEYLTQRSDTESTFPDFNAPTATTSAIDDTTRTRSVFAQAEVYLPHGALQRDGVLTLGVRRDRHSEFGSESSPFVGVRTTVDATETTLRAAYGEGFRAPKPSELLDPFVGNVGLGPETSESVDVGLAQPLPDGLGIVELTWFRLRTDDLIAFDAASTTTDRPFGRLVNLSRTETEGWEAAVSVDLGAGLRARGSFTRQDPRDRETGTNLPNRSQRFGSAGVSWADGPFEVSLDGFFSGRNHDQGGEFPYPEPRERRAPGRRRIVDLNARYAVSDVLSVFVRVENLLDDDWVATPGGPAGPPAAVYFGARLDF